MPVLLQMFLALYFEQMPAVIETLGKEKNKNKRVPVKNIFGLTQPCCRSRHLKRL